MAHAFSHGAAAKKIMSPSASSERSGQGGLLGLREELHDRRLPFAALHLDEGEPLGAEALRDLLKGLELALRQVGQPLGVERLDGAARGDCRLEHLERGGLERLREIPELESRTAGRACRRRSGSSPRRTAIRGKGVVDVGAEDVLPDLPQHALEQRVDVLAVDERGLDVHLGELHLAVGAQVLVAEAAGDLEIPLHARRPSGSA